MGHFLPQISIARALAAKGHEVAFCAQTDLLREVECAGFAVFDTGGATTFRDPSVRSPLLKPDMEREYRVVRESYAGRIARQRAPAIIERATKWHPDLLVCDEMDFGGMVAAECLSLPYATILVIASGMLVKSDLISEPLNALRAEHGLPPDPGLKMLNRYLVLSPFPSSFRDPANPLPSTSYAFRASAPDDATKAKPPSWFDALPDRPIIYVTLGTVFNVESGDLFQRLLAGLRALPVTLVVMVGPQIDPAELGPQPENVHVEQFLDQWLILSRCDLVVSHAGSGTALGALVHGLPMVLLPMGADQPLNAKRCEALGVARVLDPFDATPEMIREIVVALLASADHRQAAERIKGEIAAMPGLKTAVALLESLVQDKGAPLAN
jgi:UDP:flavonoid glycosyltransferase YjiC (YdhE family)